MLNLWFFSDALFVINIFDHVILILDHVIQ